MVILAVAIPLAIAACAFIARSGETDAARPLFRLLRYTFYAEIALLAALAAIGLVYEHRTRTRDAQLYPPPGKLIDIGGYRLHIHCAGTGGPTVVLEYGLEASYLDWRLVQPEIARFTRVCVYDRAGYGWSDRSSRPRIPSAMAEELHDLLHAGAQAGPYILVAHSFGSYNAIMFAHKYPSDVVGLVLVDGMHTLSDFPFPLKNRISMRAIQLLMPFGLPRWRRWCGGSGPEELRAEKQAITCRAGLYSTFYRENASLPESAAEIRQITSLGEVPVMVIARDPAISYPDEREKWDLIQRQKLALSTKSELLIASGSGHDIPTTRPDLIVDAVKKLVAQSPGTGGQPGKF